MKLLRTYSDEHGETHFGHVDWTMTEHDFAPPSPTGYAVTEARPATDVRIMRVPAGYVDEWHPVPSPMLVTLLTGRLRLETSNGDHRIIETGQQFLNEDVSGKGHRMFEVDGKQYHMALVSLADVT